MFLCVKSAWRNCCCVHAVHILLFAIITIMPDRHLQGKKLEQKATHSKIIFLSSWLNFNLTFTFWPSRKRFLLFNHIAVPDTMEPDIYTGGGGGNFSTFATSNVSMHNA